MASIRLSKPTVPGGVYGIKATTGGTGYTAANVPVKLMISLMYRVPMRQIRGGPEWLASDAYDVADGELRFTLAWLPELPPNVPRENLSAEVLDRPSLVEAVRDQLGLKLTAGRGRRW